MSNDTTVGRGTHQEPVAAEGRPAEVVGGNGDWRRKLSGLQDRLRAEVGSVADLRAVAARRGELSELLADLDRQIERCRGAAVVTLVGASGAGKSALLNALVGRPIAAEGVDRPTTRRPVIYAPDDADLTELLQDHGKDGGPPPEVVRYDPAVDPWAAHVLVDAPDLNSVAEDHLRTVRELAERSDVLVVVLHRQSVVEAVPAQFLDSFAPRRGLLFVLNRTDELTAPSRDQLVGQIRDLAVARWQAADAPVVAVSARVAQAQPAAPDWVELRRVLAQTVREGGLMTIRRHNALGAAQQIAELFRAVSREASPDLEALPAEVAAGLQVLTERLSNDVCDRLALRRGDAQRLLWAEMSDRWDGPGGWALRAGGMSALGLGAGALLVRRNPLLAAGAAAGGAAAEYVQGAVQGRRLADPAGLLPGSAELGAWYGEALSSARVRAARLTGEPEAFGLPGSDDAHAVAGEVVTESWRDLIDRELPRAAERSALRFFRLTLDLPVYALVGWVVYRVITGFFAEKYAGVDFLLNAALLAGAYLFAIRTLVRHGLSWRARRLMARAIRQTRAALSARFEKAAGRVGAAVSERKKTLADLADLRATWRAELQRFGGPEAGA